MSNLSFTLRDSATMLRRDVRHSLRRLSMTLSGLLTPIVTLVLFVYVFGGTLSAGLGVVALFTLAITWMGVLFGLVGKTPAGANSLSLIFQLLLPLTSSAFVRPDSMPVGVRWF